jgi:hypothetical protein
MNPEIMREALERIASIRQANIEDDPEEILEKLDFAVITAKEALIRAAIPPEIRN